MGGPALPTISNALGIWRLKDLDGKWKGKFLTHTDRKYIFVVAESEPKKPSDGVIILFFPHGPHGSNESIAFIRVGDGPQFRKYFKLISRGDPDFSFEIRHYAADEPTVALESINDFVRPYPFSDGKTVDSVATGIFFVNSTLREEEYCAWEETAGQKISYKSHFRSITDETHSRKVLQFHGLRKPPNSKFAVEILTDKNGKNPQRLIPPEQVFPVLSKALIMGLVHTNYWRNDLTDRPANPKYKVQRPSKPNNGEPSQSKK